MNVPGVGQLWIDPSQLNVAGAGIFDAKGALALALPQPSRLIGVPDLPPRLVSSDQNNAQLRHRDGAHDSLGLSPLAIQAGASFTLLAVKPGEIALISIGGQSVDSSNV